MDRGDKWWQPIIGILRGEVEVQKEDLDSSCLGGCSEGEGFAGECSQIHHVLPPIVIGGINHACTQVFFTESDRIGSMSLQWHMGG